MIVEPFVVQVASWTDLEDDRGNPVKPVRWRSPGPRCPLQSCHDLSTQFSGRDANSCVNRWFGGDQDLVLFHANPDTPFVANRGPETDDPPARGFSSTLTP